MRFTVVPVGGVPSTAAPGTAYLFEDNWNDWFKYQTQCFLRVVDSASGSSHDIGQVKIGQFSWRAEQHRPDITSAFDFLDDRFFSVGQDDSYYQELMTLNNADRHAVLTALHDVANDLDLLDRTLSQKVMEASLLRSFSAATVRNQYARILNGGARLSSYQFAYQAPPMPNSISAPVVFDFSVMPGSSPPTNVHVLIGRNGVGKTRLLDHIARAWARESDTSVVGVVMSNQEASKDFFANLVSVSFSAFDSIQPLSHKDYPWYHYVGIKRTSTKQKVS